jgi:hypothetical protein
MTHTDGPPHTTSAGQPQPRRVASQYDDGVVHHPHDDGEGHDDWHNEGVEHEHSDINVRALIASVVGLFVVTAIVSVLMYVMFWWLEARARKNDPVVSPLSAPAQAMPSTTTESPYFGQARGGAQLLTNEPMALQKLRDEELKRLHQYGWVEGKPGVARMPIDAAKKLILERGLPVRAGEPIDPTFGTRPAVRGEASSGRTIPTGRKQPEASGTAPPTQPASPHSTHKPSGQ